VEEDMDRKYLLAKECAVDCLHEFNQKTLIGIYKLEMVKKYIKAETIQEEKKGENNMKYIKIHSCEECKWLWRIKNDNREKKDICRYPDTLGVEIMDKLEIQDFCKHKNLIRG